MFKVIMLTALAKAIEDSRSNKKKNSPKQSTRPDVTYCMDTTPVPKAIMAIAKKYRDGRRFVKIMPTKRCTKKFEEAISMNTPGKINSIIALAALYQTLPRGRKAA